MPSKVWDKNIYPFPNFNDYTVEDWEWIRNAIPNFILGVTTYRARSRFWYSSIIHDVADLKYIYIYMYIYMFVCVYVCVCGKFLLNSIPRELTGDK